MVLLTIGMNLSKQRHAACRRIQVLPSPDPAFIPAAPLPSTSRRIGNARRKQRWARCGIPLCPWPKQKQRWFSGRHKRANAGRHVIGKRRFVVGIRRPTPAAVTAIVFPRCKQHNDGCGVICATSGMDSHRAWGRWCTTGISRNRRRQAGECLPCETARAHPIIPTKLCR